MQTDVSGEITLLLARAAHGDHGALDSLFRRIYDELNHIAERLMRNERANHTLGPGDLVHEAVGKLIDGPSQLIALSNRRMLFFVAARAMRQTLVDYAKRRNAQKRPGKWKQSPLDSAIAAVEDRQLDIIELHRALKDLERVAPRQAEIMQLRFYAGLKVAEVAKLLHLSQSTVEKELKSARDYLLKELSDSRQ